MEPGEIDLATHEVMRSALLALSERQRCAIVLRYYEDLPDAQIADMMHCRQATVRSLVARGLSALKSVPEVIG